MEPRKKSSKIFQKISWWITSNVWPWSEIWRLREDLRFVRSNLDSFLNQEAQHKGKWMATANRSWGPEPFSNGEFSAMEHFYEQGYGWQDALVRLRIYRGWQESVKRVTQ